MTTTKQTPVVDESIRIEVMKKLPRKLDKRPKVIRVQSVKDIEPFGIQEFFQMMYNTSFENLNSGSCYLDMSGNVIEADRECFCVLHTLLKMGINKDSSISMACKNVFMSVMNSCATLGYKLTNEVLLDMLTNNKFNAYEEQQIISAIRCTVFPDSDVNIYWQSIISEYPEYENLNSVGIQYIKSNDLRTVKSLQEMLKTGYTMSRRNKDFCKAVEKGLPKEIIGMMYLNHVDHPEVFQVVRSADKDGFL